MSECKRKMKRIALVLSLLVLLGACAGKVKVNKEEIPPTSIQALVGNYVSEGYKERSDGADWVAVVVKQWSDSTAHISVRSRADLKKPTCRFDATATIFGQDTLRAVYEGKGILFVFAGDKLSIAAQDREDDNLLYYFCSGGASLTGEYSKITGEIDQKQMDQRAFHKALSLQGITFDITAIDNELTIQPIGLTIDNSKVTHDILGCTVGNAEIGDLNADGYPEVLVYLVSDGSGSYGTVIGYSVNNGKSMSQIPFPSVADNPEVSKGYMGHDEFAIVEHSFRQRFPIYKENDTNANPTGGMRQIQYKLKEGEASRQWVIDEVLSF